MNLPFVPFEGSTFPSLSLSLGALTGHLTNGHLCYFYFYFYSTLLVDILASIGFHFFSYLLLTPFRAILTSMA